MRKNIRIMQMVIGQDKQVIVPVHPSIGLVNLRS